MQERHLVDENKQSINSSNPLAIREFSFVSDENSSTDLLNSAAVFVGEWVDVLQFSVILVTVKSNVASATDGLCVDWSANGVDIIDSDVFSIPAATGKTFSFQPVARYAKITYTNGGSNQTSFDLHTQLKSDYVKPSSHRIQDSIISDDDAELVKAVFTAKRDDNVFVNISATDSNNLRVTDAESGLAIAKGEVAGTSFIHKFGEAPDFDITDGFVSVWDGADDAGIGAFQYTYSETADIDSLVSSNNSDTQDISIDGLDVDFNKVSQTVTLTGQTKAALSTNLIRIYRMGNVGSVDVLGNISCYVDSAITAGVVDDSTKVRAIIRDGNNQTLMAVYTIPAGKTGYLREWYASLSKKKTAISTIRLYARIFGQVFQLKHTKDINTNGTSSLQHIYAEPEVFAEKTDLEMRADTSTDTNGVSAGFDIVLVDN